jgi:hypothetical protein
MTSERRSGRGHDAHGNRRRQSRHGKAWTAREGEAGKREMTANRPTG